MSAFIVGISAVIYFQANLLVLLKLDEMVPQPYMDEIFHVPQTQQYCLGNYQEVQHQTINNQLNIYLKDHFFLF